MRVSNRDKANRTHPIMKGWSVKLISTAILACLASSAGHTSDLEIYQAASNGNASIMMMLDNSGSMNYNSIPEDYPAQGFSIINFFGIYCSPFNSVKTDTVTQRLYDNNGIAISGDAGLKSYSVTYCENRSGKYYDRMSRLKRALIPMFANPKGDKGFGADVDLTKYKIGLGRFLGSGGKIDSSVAPLTLEHRKLLIDKIIALQPETATPIANAYAEAGAYMLGTKTSATSSAYTSPMPNNPSQCDGYGIYFLTDGEPNGISLESDTRSLMNTSLVGGSRSIGSSCQSGLDSTGTVYQGSNQGSPGWECIGEYARALYSKDNVKKDNIATATVGFGNVYKKLKEKGIVSKVITRPGKPPETVDVYQCDASGISPDAKNLCKLGEKGQEHGEGGFYYTEEPQEIAASVKSFIEEVGSTEIDSISTGTMSVPLDSLGGLESRQFAYLPILEPIPGSSQLWNGNLKKYKVRNSTLLGGDNNFVFSDNSGLFAKNTYDLWNTLDSSRPDALRPDRSLPQVGGAYQKVFENTGATTSGSRNLFIDNGSSLVNLKVTADKKPVNFNTLTTANGYTNPKKITLLNFMGYGEPVPTAPSTGTPVTDGTAITASLNTGLKNIGGVLHSIPQLITTKVAVDATGKFNTNQRQDYVIYGSMDGALHMLDDKTGKEVFTFVPKQILDLQPKALAGNGTAEGGSYPYGVDAPWLTYVSYTTKATTTGEGDAATTVNTYEAEQSFALGGLRMGGSMYYALDVSNVNTPKIIYGIGSNYANRLAGDTTALSGTKNNTTGTATEEQKAFAKMGQSWGKPTLGYVKSGGKRVMVSFLPGGYDTCYEDSNFKLNDATNSKAACKSKGSAQGNSVYMVQVGETKTNDNNEQTVDTSKNNGNLLWWANDSGIGSNSTSRSTSLQYSKTDSLKHSVVTQIRALDRNYDGLIDHIYFADLGGQVWRADINNDATTDNFKVDRVVKVLDVSDQVGTGDAPPRIYERPLVTFYNDKFGYIDEANTSGSARGVQAMITVGTGDRSNPVTATRNVPDALYNIIDKDVSRSDLFYYGTGTAPTISLRTPINKVAGTSARNDKLQMLTFSAADISKAGTEAAGGSSAIPAVLGIKEKMQNGVIQGWYMPFNAWLNEPKQTAGPYKMKMFNEPDALAGILISSSYNPDKGQAIQTCSAGVKGATQRERTCLPYGTCLDSTGNAVVTARSTFNAGSGIVDNIVTQFNDTSIFSGLVNRCEGATCTPKVICPSGDCDPVPPKCTGPTCSPLDGFNTDKRINPLSWIEH